MLILSSAVAVLNISLATVTAVCLELDLDSKAFIVCFFIPFYNLCHKSYGSCSLFHNSSRDCLFGHHCSITHMLLVSITLNCAIDFGSTDMESLLYVYCICCYSILFDLRVYCFIKHTAYQLMFLKGPYTFIIIISN